MPNPYPWEDFTFVAAGAALYVVCPHCGERVEVETTAIFVPITVLIDTAGEHLRGLGGREKCRGKASG